MYIIMHPINMYHNACVFINIQYHRHQEPWLDTLSRAAVNGCRLGPTQTQWEFCLVSESECPVVIKQLSMWSTRVRRRYRASNTQWARPCTPAHAFKFSNRSRLLVGGISLSALTAFCQVVWHFVFDVSCVAFFFLSLALTPNFYCWILLWLSRRRQHHSTWEKSVKQ